MPTQTLLPGKDSPLEETLKTAIDSLAHFGIELQEMSCLTPVPLCWSVHLQDSSCPDLYTNGKGTSKLASMTSGFGEFIERLSTDFFFSQYYLGSYQSLLMRNPFVFYPDELWFTPGSQSADIELYCHIESKSSLLTPELIQFYNPDHELQSHHLLDNNIDDNKRGICGLPFTHLTDSSTCYFPVSLLNNLYVSNGMAAGNSPNECKAQALSEIIERYVKNKVIAGGLSLPAVPDELLVNFPHLISIRDSLQQNGFSVTIHDSSLGGTFPVICVLLVDNENGGVYAAFGANCRFEVAIERTLTELLQGRNLDTLHDFSFPVHNIEMVADGYNLESHFIDSDGLLAWSMFKDSPDFALSPWSFDGNTSDEVKKLTNCISSCGFSMYLRDYRHCGLYSCRIIVPGMSEIYPVDDLVWNNRNRGSLLRPEILQLSHMSSTQLEATLDLLDELELDDQLLLSHVIGVLFDDGCHWKTLRIGELRAHIYLALGDRGNAAQWCEWVVNYGALGKERTGTFRAIATLLQLGDASGSTNSYSNNIRRFIHKADIQTAEQIIAGKESFFGLTFESTWEEISLKHLNLITLYNRLRAAKSRAS
ncbi:YcaO-like family protein [Desulforhopalus sp. 52FAK]